MAQSTLTAHMEWKEDRGVIERLQVQSIEGLQVAVLCRNLLQVLGLCHRRKHLLNLLPLPAEYQTCAAGAVSPTQTPNAQITCSCPKQAAVTTLCAAFSASVLGHHFSSHEPGWQFDER